MPQFHNDVIVAFADGLHDGSDDGQTDIVGTGARLRVRVLRFLGSLA